MIHLQASLGKRLRENEPLARYTAARLGGVADWLYVADRTLDELTAVVSEVWRMEMPARILGGGANVLISDQGVRGLVVINHLSEITFVGERRVIATAGTGLAKLARKCAARGLSGFEWAISVPGTVGGAVVNNAGAHGGDMAANIQSVTLVDAVDGQQILTPDDLAYDYRTSSLKQRDDRRFLVLSAEFAFELDAVAAIEGRMEANVAYRKRTQPPGASLGSIFKNPPDDYAGRLIEAADLKGFGVGDAMVSPVHANFFINTGSATASDYYRLIQQVQDAVFQKFNVLLELEIELVGDSF
jgi:UDP-N-acetylmuramate dehydrogenase